MLLLTLLLSLSTELLAIPNCNLRTVNKGSGSFDFGDGLISKNYPTPKGECDRYRGSSRKSCKRLAKSEGYDCWQFEKWTVSQYDLGYGKRTSTVYKCFGCYKDTYDSNEDNLPDFLGQDY